MKTAKEIAAEVKNVNEWTIAHGLYVFDKEKLKAYADALCKEQRSSCLEAYEDDWKSESILTAPQPEAL